MFVLFGNKIISFKKCVDRIEALNVWNLFIFHKSSDEYCAGVDNWPRFFLATLAKISILLNTLRFGISAIYNKVIKIFFGIHYN